MGNRFNEVKGFSVDEMAEFLFEIGGGGIDFCDTPCEFCDKAVLAGDDDECKRCIKKWLLGEGVLM